jgi:hypothetical protein
MTSILLTERIFSAGAEAVVSVRDAADMTAPDKNLSPPLRRGEELFT